MIKVGEIRNRRRIMTWEWKKDAEDMINIVIRREI